MKNVNIIAGCLTVALAGCSGVQFKDAGVMALPSDFVNRTPIDNTASYRFHLDQNIGAVIVPDPAHPGQYRFTGKTILPPDVTPSEEVLDRSTNSVYSSKVSYGATATAAIANMFNLAIDSQNSNEITIVDIARSDVPTDKIEGALPGLLAEKTAKGGKKEYWVKSLLLSQVIKKAYTKEASDTKGSGPAYGASINGSISVYATDDHAAVDYYLGADLIDLDDIPTPMHAAMSPPLKNVKPVLLGRITLNR